MRRKSTLKDDFFVCKTQETAYWAGFINARGHLGSGKNQNRILFNLAKKHKDALVKFLDVVGSNAVIKETEDRVMVNIYSKQWIQDLLLNFHMSGTKKGRNNRVGDDYQEAFEKGMNL